MDWLENLNFELERRDRRHTFHWAVIASLVTAGFYIASRLLWNAPPFSSRVALAAAALGAVGFAFFVTRLVARFVEELHPSQAYHEGSLARVIVMLRFVRNHGFGARFWLDLPLTLAYAISGTALAFLGNQSDGWQRVAEFVLAGWLIGLFLADILFPLVPRRVVASLLAFIFEGSLSSTPQWAELKRDAEPFLREIHAGARIPIIRPTLGNKRKVAARFFSRPRYVRRAAILGAFAALLSETSPAWLASPVREPGAIAAFVEVISLTIIGLTILHLVVLMYHDRTRKHIEQLRFALLTRTCTEERVAYLYETIDFLKSANLYSPLGLHDLADGLGIDGLHRTLKELSEARASRQGPLEKRIPVDAGAARAGESLADANSANGAT